MARTAHIAVSGLGLALLAGSGCPLGTAAFSVAPSQSQSLSAPQRHMSASATRLYNVPPPSMDDKEAVQETSDREQPPASFFELQENSARAAQLALDDGHTLIEVEFPPLPASVLEMAALAGGARLEFQSHFNQVERHELPPIHLFAHLEH